MLKTTAVVLLLVAVLAVAGAGVASAQTALSAPVNIRAVDGANTGEARLTWNAARGASQYRVGWINMNDFRRTQQTGEPWLERFAFVNIRASLTAYTIGRLTPGEEYAFIVASVPAAGNPVWPQQWAYLTTAAAPTTSVCPPGTPSPAPTPSPTPAPSPTPSAQTPLTNEQLVRLVKPALAQVVATNSAGETGAGTGFVVRSSGLLVTNRHVVEDAQTVTVYMQNLEGQLFEYTGRVLGRGILADLAVVQLPAGRTYSVLQLGDSDAVSGGADVIAMGYPSGSISNTYPTVTRGIISSKGILEDTRYLQTDAAINPGNSGGPLVNRYGRVIGVNTSGVESVGDRPIEGISFAIASNEVASRLDTLVAGGPNSATYHNLQLGRGYRVDIPKGWYLNTESSDCTTFWTYDRIGDSLLCARDISAFTGISDKLAALAQRVWNNSRSYAGEQGYPLFQLNSFDRITRNGRDFYRLEYRQQTGSQYCVDHRVMLVALSSSNPQRLGFSLDTGVCEGGLNRYDAERQAMLNSFVP